MLNIIAGTLSTGVAAVVAPPVSGYTLWLNAVDASKFTYSSSNIVSAWADGSASANNATQATVAYQPTRVNSVLNGLPMVRFGTSTTKALSFVSNMGGNQTTLFFVTNTSGTITSTGTIGALATYNGATNATGGVIAMGGNWTGSVANERIYWANRLNNGVAYNSADISSGGHIFTFVLDAPSSSGSIYLDNSSLGLTSFNGGFSSGNYGGNYDCLGNNGVGSAEAWIGDIGEVILYPSVLSGTDITSVSNYLKTKWGTP